MLKISTKTLYNKLRAYEAGARWRDGSAASTSWGARDSEKSMQEGEPDHPRRLGLAGSRFLARSQPRNDRARDQAVVAGAPARAQGTPAQRLHAGCALAEGECKRARRRSAARRGAPPRDDGPRRDRGDEPASAPARAPASWQEPRNGTFCEVQTGLSEVLQAVRVEAARRQIQVRLDVMPEPTLIVCPPAAFQQVILTCTIYTIQLRRSGEAVVIAAEESNGVTIFDFLGGEPRVRTMTSSTRWTSTSLRRSPRWRVRDSFRNRR